LRVRVRRAFRRRWVQVCLIALVWLLALGISFNRLGPKPNKDPAKLQFMHCDNEVCHFEIPYNKDMDGKWCPKCQGQKREGFFVGTEKSIKTGAQMSPWTRVYVAAFVETVLMLAGITYLLYRPVPDLTNLFFVISCPYCNQRLRYRAVSHGGQGACSRCKRILKFPDEEDAVTEEEVLRADAAQAEAEMRRAQAEAEGDQI
jgi:hypothetical protein